MRNVLLVPMLSCLVFPVFIETSMADDLQPTCYHYEKHAQQDLGLLQCYNDCQKCTASCDAQYFTPKYDIMGHLRVESAATHENRIKCKNTCLSSIDSCFENKTKEEKTFKEEKLKLEEEKLINKLQNEEEEPNTSTSSKPSDSKIYRWKDKDGVVHITNNWETIPSEYRNKLINNESK